MSLQNVIDNNTLIILGICGFLTVCFGLLLFAFFTIFRFSGRNFMAFLSMLVRNQKDVDKDDNPVARVNTPNLRRIADEDDFDAALAKHMVTDPLSKQANPAPTASAYTAPAAASVSPTPSTPYNPPLQGAPKPPTVLPGYLPGSVQPANPPPPAPNTYTPPRPQSAQPQNPTVPTSPNDFGWENPSLRTPNLQKRTREEQERDEDDLLGGFMP